MAFQGLPQGEAFRGDPWSEGGACFGQDDTGPSAEVPHPRTPGNTGYDSYGGPGRNGRVTRKRDRERDSSTPEGLRDPSIRISGPTWDAELKKSTCLQGRLGRRDLVLLPELGAREKKTPPGRPL